jgi:hypothetical protein
LAAAVVVAGLSQWANADWIAHGEAGVAFDSNLNNAQLKQDIHDDASVRATLTAGQLLQLDRNFSLTLTAGVNGETYQRFSGMSNVSLGGTVALRRKFGLGSAAPWLRVSGSAARLQFNNDIRDGWLVRGSVAGGKRFAEQWEVQARYDLERRTGDRAARVIPTIPGNVFDLRSQTIALDLRYSASETTLLFGGYAWRDGDVVSTSTPNFKIFRASSAISPDPVFGPNNFAYRIDAMSHIATLGVSQGIGQRSALNVSYQRQMTHAERDNNYFKSIFAASYSYHFF